MAGRIFVDVSEAPLNLQDAHDFVAEPGHGAVNSFVGVVRDTNLGKNVEGVSYDVFVPLARQSFQEICESVKERFAGKINIYLTHFKGRLPVGGASVIIMVSTPHRAESFEACRMIIEDLKHKAPIWKKEHYVDGDSEWVKGHSLCQHG